jgi:hypothetical protein
LPSSYPTDTYTRSCWLAGTLNVLFIGVQSPKSRPTASGTCSSVTQMLFVGSIPAQPHCYSHSWLTGHFPDSVPFG